MISKYTSNDLIYIFHHHHHHQNIIHLIHQHKEDMLYF